MEQLAGPRSRTWSTWALVRDPYGFYESCRQKYGDTFLIKALNGDVVCTGDPAVIRDLLRADTHEVRPFAVDAITPLVGPGSVLSLWGPRHREERRLLTPPFHGARMRAYGQVMLDSVESETASFGTQPSFRAADAMLGVSIRVIVQAVFGVLEPERVQQWTSAVRELVDAVPAAALFFTKLQRAPLGLGPWGRFLRARAAMDGLLYAEISERKRSGRRGEDILSMMLDARHEGGAPMTDEEIRDELVTLLFAGHETTQIAMAWMLYHVARNERVRTKLLEELDASDGAPETLARLPYLDATVHETLRVYPIVPDFIRTLVVPLSLGGHALPAGTHVAMITSLVHTRSELYPEPHEFRPERFLERTFKPHEFLAFGGGVRRCLGAALAVWEMKVVVGTLLRRWAFRSLSEESPVRRNLTVGTRHGVLLSATSRAARAAAA
jgi:cytochrome P450